MFLVKLEKNKLSRTLYIILLYCLLSFTLKAQFSNIEFIENKGQWHSSIKYLGQAGSGAFYIQSKGFSVLQHNAQDWENISESFHHRGHSLKQQLENKNLQLRSHLYKVEFLGGNDRAEIIADKPLITYNNYFIGNDPAKWATNCKIYQGVTLKDIYPNIDVRYYSNNGLVKYDIIVHPHADLSKIALKYEGVEKLEVKNKELLVATSVGTVKELSPYSYQNSLKGRQQVNCRYSVKNNVVRFQVDEYDPNSTLVIDPSLVFSSFSGSTADNWGFTATYGPDGSMYGGGIVFGQGFPVNPGTYDSTYSGGVGLWQVDIGIIKLTPDGSNRVYATYLGGSGSEIPQSLICDPQGNLIVAGRTNGSDYPTTGSGLIGPGGKFDIIITKLNAAGNGLIGSKRIGGSEDDGANISSFGSSGPNSLERNYGDEARSEVILDGAGNIWLASCSRSLNFPLVSAFQASKAGAQDGIILRFDPNVSSLAFSSYLGGSGDDAAYVLAINPTNGNVYVAGGTASSDFPGNKAGTIGPNPAGNIDGFVAIISGTSLIRSTYLGTSSIDQVYGIQFDRFGFPYVMGQTTGSWPVVNATYVNAGAKQFISKLQPDLSNWVYSTTFGKSASLPSISPTAFLVDRCENVYVSGWGGGFGENPGSWEYPNSNTQGLPVTPDAIKSTSDGRDFYFFVLKKNAASQLYGSFFGENNNPPTNIGCDHVDGGTSRFDQNGVIYQAICANCKSFGPATFPTTAGAWSTNNPANSGGGCNLALVKIAFNLAGVHAGVQSTINGVPRDSSGCVPLTVDFSDTVANGVTYEWTFGDGSPMVITTVPSISHTYNAVGNYLVMLVAVDSSTCNMRDTSYINIRVGSVQANPDFTFQKIGDCQSTTFSFTNITVSPPPFSFGPKSFSWSFGDGTRLDSVGPGPVTHTFPSPGTYNVRLILLDTNFCNSPDSVMHQVRIAANVVASFTTPLTGCVPYTAIFNNTSSGGQTFQWDFGDGTTSTAINPTHIYNTPGTYLVRLTATDPFTCNITDDTTITITVYPIPIADFSYTPVTPVENVSPIFTNNSSPDAIRFKWLWGDGDSTITTSRNPITHEYNSTGTFNACLIATNTAGCTDTVCKQVTTLVVPVVGVPNAFTPQTNDGNNVVYVRGFGITKMRFIIWNRWGQKVFETASKKIGWDGKFKGVLQPMDVYAYTLEVEFFDGTKTVKKGDITLIR